MDNLTVGVVCLARQTFDFEEARRQYHALQTKLNEIESINFKFVKDLLFEVEDAEKAADELSRYNPDGLICISGTFHLGHLVPVLLRKIRKPVLLWALKEPPYDGGKIRLNSICGVNLNASNLYKSGIRDYHACFGNEPDYDWFKAMQVAAALKNGRFGVAGSRAHGFFNLAYDELDAWHNTGVLVDYYQLAEIFNHPAEEASVNRYQEKLNRVFCVKHISGEQLNKVALLAAKLAGFMDHYRLQGLAVRCWPEFAGSFGIAPCAALSLLQSEGRILACEGDVQGMLSMYAHRIMGAETPFLADLSQVDFEKDEVLLWHCGVAPCNLWDGRCEISLDTYFAGGKGVTADFVLKEGPVSVMRIDSAGRETRVFLKRGEALPMDKQLKGTYARVKFSEGTEDVMKQVVDNGIAHHLSVVYGDYNKPMEILAKIKGWQVIH